MTDPEVLENRFPVRLEEFSIRKGSGGQGAFVGGDGIVRKLRFLTEMTATVLTSHRKTAPFGAAGGAAGKRGENAVIRTDGTRVPLGGNGSWRYFRTQIPRWWRLWRPCMTPTFMATTRAL